MRSNSQNLPISIIYYMGGSCGEFLKSISNNQLTLSPLFIDTAGKVTANNAWKEYLVRKLLIEGTISNLNNTMPLPDPIEYSHVFDKSLISLFPNSKWYHIRPAKQCLGIIAEMLEKKWHLPDMDSWRRAPSDYLPWINFFYRLMLENGFSNIYSFYTDPSSPYHKSHQLDLSQHGFTEIELTDILDAEKCSIVVGRLLGQGLLHTELFYEQHAAWSWYNANYIKLISNACGIEIATPAVCPQERYHTLIPNADPRAKHTT